MEDVQRVLIVIALSLIGILILLYGFAGITGDAVLTVDAPPTIGVIAPLSGDAAPYGKNVKRGVELAAEESQLGASLVYADSRCTTEEAIKAFDELVRDHHVQAVIGDVCSEVTAALIREADERHVVLISPAATDPELASHEGYFFRTISTQSLNVPGASDTLLRNQSAAAYSIASRNSESFRENYRAMYGMQPGPFASQAYDAFNALRQVFQQGANTSIEMRSALHGIEFEGASGVISFDAQGNLLAHYTTFVPREY